MTYAQELYIRSESVAEMGKMVDTTGGSRMLAQSLLNTSGNDAWNWQKSPQNSEQTLATHGLGQVSRTFNQLF